MLISKSTRALRAGFRVGLVTAIFCSGAFAIEPLKPAANGDVGLAQGAVSFAHQLELLGTNNWTVESRDPNARTLDLARVATMRRILMGAAKRFTKIAEQKDLELSPAFRNGLNAIATKLRVVYTSKQFYDPPALGRALSGIASEIEGRFGSAGPMEKPSGMLARLRKPRAEVVAAHDAALVEMGRVFEYAALELTLMTMNEEEALTEIRYFLKDSGMDEAAALVTNTETFWAGVNESLAEIAQVMQNTSAEIRPLVANEKLPPEYIAGMNQIWRILKNEPAKPQTAAAGSPWFPGREKLRNFGSPAKCEQLLTIQNENGSSQLIIENRRTINKPQPAESAAKSAPDEQMIPL